MLTQLTNLLLKKIQHPSILSEKEEEKLKEIVKEKVDEKKFNIQIESLSSTDSPFTITQSEYMRRMKEQQQLSAGMNVFGDLPENYNLVVNSNHPLTSEILNEKNKRSNQIS